MHNDHANACNILFPLYNGKKEKGLHVTHATLKAFQSTLSHHLHNNIVVLEQKGGDKVSVPVGWAHQVETHFPCLKMAWDYYASSNDLVQLARLQRNVPRWLLRAKDYAAVYRVAINYLEVL